MTGFLLDTNIPSETTKLRPEHKVPTLAGLIAATAAEHNLTVVTRNVKDFATFGVLILNPWD